MGVWPDQLQGLKMVSAIIPSGVSEVFSVEMRVHRHHLKAVGFGEALNGFTRNQRPALADSLGCLMQQGLASLSRQSKDNQFRVPVAAPQPYRVAGSTFRLMDHAESLAFNSRNQTLFKKVIAISQFSYGLTHSLYAHLLTLTPYLRFSR